MEDELHPIEVVLARMDGESIMLVKTPPTSDYDSHAKAIAWMSTAKTGRARVIAMSPLNGDVPVAQQPDEPERAEKTCPMDECTLGPEHVPPHQDLEGDRWDSLDLLGNRVVETVEKARKSAGAFEPSRNGPGVWCGTTGCGKQDDHDGVCADAHGEPIDAKHS